MVNDQRRGWMSAVSEGGLRELLPEQIAAHDDQRDLGEDGEQALVRALQSVLVPGTVVLDAGGGSGVAVPFLRAAGAQVVLVDWAMSMLQAAAERAHTRVAGDLARLPVRTESLDAVHAAYALQNVGPWQDAIAECVRVIRPGGAVLVAWGGPPVDGRLAALESAYFTALGSAAGVRAERSGLTVPLADEAFRRRGCLLERTLSVPGVQRRTPRQVLARAAANPYRTHAGAQQRQQAVQTALAWACEHDLPVDEPIELAVLRTYHVYRRTSPSSQLGREARLGRPVSAGHSDPDGRRWLTGSWRPASACSRCR